METTSGSIYKGFVTKETKDFVTLENRITNETVELRKNSILRVSSSKSRDLSNDLMGENYHARNYMLSRTAFPFEANKTSSTSHWLLLENINYAFNENMAISVTTLIFYPVSVGFKCSFPMNDNNYIGGSLFGVGDILSGAGGSLLFGYGAQGHFTKGNSNKNITLSGGVLGLNNDFFYTSQGASFVNLSFFSAAYCNRFTKKVALNLEAWYLPEVRAGLGGFAFKFVGDEITCWTVGCYAFMNTYDNSLRLNLKALPLPYFGISKRFN